MTISRSPRIPPTTDGMMISWSSIKSSTHSFSGCTGGKVHNRDNDDSAKQRAEFNADAAKQCTLGIMMTWETKLAKWWLGMYNIRGQVHNNDDSANKNPFPSLCHFIAPTGPPTQILYEPPISIHTHYASSAWDYGLYESLDMWYGRSSLH